MTAVGFVRGEQFVELASRDLSTGDFNFYLVSFEQKCSYANGGCDLASLLTEEIEHDWTAYSVYDQDDLEGTSLDCNSCHQPNGHGTKRILRMQELASPWLHWFPQRFVQRTDSDRVLLAQFADTHAGDKHYGGIPIATITNALDEGSGAQLEALVRAEGFGDQPNPFDAQIVAELKSGTSPTWEARFETHLQGRAIAVPYPAIDVTDEAKRNAATRSYQDVVRGALRARACSTSVRSSRRRATEAELRSAARRRREDRLAGDVRALPRRARQSSAGQEPIQRARARRDCRARRRTSPSRGSAIRGERACRPGARDAHAGKQRRGDPRAAEVVAGGTWPGLGQVFLTESFAISQYWLRPCRTAVDGPWRREADPENKMKKPRMRVVREARSQSSARLRW